MKRMLIVVVQHAHCTLRESAIRKVTQTYQDARRIKTLHERSIV